MSAQDLHFRWKLLDMRYCVLLLLILINASFIIGQTVSNTHPVVLYGHDCLDCSEDDQFICIENPIEEAYKDSLQNVNIARSMANRPPNLRMPPSVQGTLIWPLRAGPGFNEFNYYVISNFVDLDTSDALLDYGCGQRTYDIDGGYDHDGIDIGTFPFPYYKIANDQVEVIAAAAGEIVLKVDGNNDDNCRWGTGRQANEIRILHDDGTITQYKHLKNGSLTSKLVNETVAQGEFLGQVASSGNSTSPHLHFEVRDASNNITDPFIGACSGQSDHPIPTTSSWWADQKPYIDSAVNALITHSGTPTFRSCDDSDSTAIPGVRRAKRYFEPGDSIVFGGYYRHASNNYTASATVYQPNNAVWDSWSDDDQFTNSFHRTRSVLRPMKLPNDAWQGRWLYQVVFEGAIYRTEFFVSTCAENRNLSGTISIPYFRKASNSINSTQTILGNYSSNTIYQAGNAIVLQPGFWSKNDSKFVTRLTNCGDVPDF